MRRILGVLPALAALGVLTACSRPSAARLNADGNHAYARRDYGSALEDYRKAQVQRPDLTALNYNAGNVLHQQGDYQRAIGESQRATRAGDAETRVRAYYSIGSDYFRQGKLKQALEAFKNALRLDPGDLDAKYNVEVIQRRLGQQARQQAQQPPDRNQPNQQGQQPQGPQSQQNQPANQQGQQQSGQQSQQGQQSPGQPGGLQQGQQSQGQSGGQQQQGQQQSGAAPPLGQQNGQQQGGAQSASGQPGSQAAPSARQQQAQLNQDLQNAIDAYQKQPTIEDALRILDILGEQERIAQAAQGSRSDPRSGDK